MRPEGPAHLQCAGPSGLEPLGVHGSVPCGIGKGCVGPSALDQIAQLQKSACSGFPPVNHRIKKVAARHPWLAPSAQFLYGLTEGGWLRDMGAFHEANHLDPDERLKQINLYFVAAAQVGVKLCRL